MSGFKSTTSLISIHALREEGDPCQLLVVLLYLISIHALREEGDEPTDSSTTNGSDFYPRPPRGGRPGQHGSTLRDHNISIHALREEGDQ